MPWSVLTTRTRTVDPAGTSTELVLGPAVQGALTRIQMEQRQPVDGRGRCPDRVDDERPEESAFHLLVRHLVRVVPVRPGVGGDEPVHVASADRDRVLRDAGDAVLGVRDVDAVPVEGRLRRPPTR